VTERVKVDLKETDQLVRELTVEIPADQVGSEMDKKFVEVRKKADIKGFRKGKVPMTMIKSLYGDEVRWDVANELVKSTLSEALQDKDLKLASSPSLQAVDFAESGELVYTVKLEIFPDLGEIDYSGLELAKEEIAVADSEVDEVSEYYRRRFADYRPVERPVKDDDQVVVDLKKKSDPKGIIEQDGFTDVEIDLARGMTVKEFKENLPGMKVGDIKEIQVTYADDYPEERFAGASVTYDCTVKVVKERILPPFDDALAKRSEQVETALELRLKIRQDLEKEKQEILGNRQRGELIRQLCEKNQIPVPEGLVEEYLESMIKDYKTKFPNADEEEIRKNYRDNSANTIRWNLLYHQLAEQEKIEVSQADTEKWIKSFAVANDMEVDRATQVLGQSGRIGNVRESILEQKVLDFLTGHTRAVDRKQE
jgi:trigger factor